MVIHIDRMVARLDSHLTDVLTVDLVEVYGQKGRGRGFAEVAGDDLLQVEFETVSILLL